MCRIGSVSKRSGSRYTGVAEGSWLSALPISYVLLLYPCILLRACCDSLLAVAGDRAIMDFPTAEGYAGNAGFCGVADILAAAGI